MEHGATGHNTAQHGATRPAWPADQVERRPLAGLIPYARNARTHSEAQIREIAASMREWGWTNPVLVDEQSSIIAGHARVLAAALNGFTEAPVMTARGWSEAKKRAYVLADNQLALNAGWNVELLAAEVKDLQASDFDIGMLGFSTKQLNEILAMDIPESADEVPAPPATPVSRPGCGKGRRCRPASSSWRWRLSSWLLSPSWWWSFSLRSSLSLCPLVSAL
jgi:hypothetical protein